MYEGVYIEEGHILIFIPSSLYGESPGQDWL